ncbi:hypothetical protein H1R17_00475 [Flavobacterium sp. xlx-214]|uniref:hypothetical protein n=1 Tax=unclassified Flavobacterium TaxID=196869 RepID=UPI0013D212B3|nr:MULTISPECIES: hypothetical protein [unclassified Flavobacterium]MBA5791174.1 hypothetical protein [Flavobacterium sp. xlx-221]QMI83656.1 hypothetical protein H1R17_00475 [Flavobacterium sp. xlx-214]
MLPTLLKKNNLFRFSFVALAGISFTACSSLNQKPYDVDGIYNNSKIVVEDTHEKSAYYTEYFKEKEQETNEYFTDVDNYSSYNEGNAAWGDTTSDTQIVYDYGYNNFWSYPYYGWGGYWGFSYGWGGYWGSPYYGYGWGYPYYGYVWGYPYYYGGRNLSRNYSQRALTNRSMAANTNATRSFRNTSLGNTRNMVRSDKTFARTNSSLTRMQIDRSQTINTSRTRIDNFNNSSRNNTINDSRTNRSNTRTIERTSRPTYTPSSSTRMNTGGGFGGSRSSGGSTGGGMRSSGGGRR